MSSEESRKYRSPTFEAISEEDNSNSPKVVDSPTYKRLSVDIDNPEKFIVQRMSKRPPSIHAALNPELLVKEFENQNPRLLVAHYENIIDSMNRNNKNVRLYDFLESNKEHEITVIRFK